MCSADRGNPQHTHPIPGGGGGAGVGRGEPAWCAGMDQGAGRMIKDHGVSAVGRVRVMGKRLRLVQERTFGELWRDW